MLFSRFGIDAATNYTLPWYPPSTSVDARTLAVYAVQYGDAWRIAKAEALDQFALVVCAGWSVRALYHLRDQAPVL